MHTASDANGSGCRQAQSSCKMEFVEQVLTQFLKDHRQVYVHCADKDSVLTSRVSNLPAIAFSLVFGHISIIDKLEERRFVLFLGTDEAWELGELHSPVVIEVTSSCLYEV